jgi:hypothetical protein
MFLIYVAARTGNNDEFEQEIRAVESLLQSVLQCQALPKDVRIAYSTDCLLFDQDQCLNIGFHVFQEHFKLLIVNFFEEYFNSVSLKFQQALC